VKGLNLLAKFLNKKSVSCNTTHPQSCNLQAMLTGKTQKG